MGREPATRETEPLGAAAPAPARAPAVQPAGGWLRSARARRLTLFFHRQSLDGLAGAWAVFTALPRELQAGLRKLGGLFGAGCAPPGAARQATVGPVFLSVVGGARPDPWLVDGREVVYIGVAPSAAVLRQVAAAAASLTLLDHHRSAAERFAALAGAGNPPEVVFDEGRSGAQLAWDWAHGAPRPAVVDYIADRALWRFRQPSSRAICRALATELHAAGFAALDALRRDPPSRRTRVRGALYLRQEAQYVEQAAAAARRGFVRAWRAEGGPPAAFRVVATNSPLLQSEVAEAILRRAAPEVDFALVWHVAPGGREVWASLRTAREDPELARVAAAVLGASSGGGGPRAAGFVVPGADISAVLAPEWRAGRARPAPKIEAAARPPMTASAFNVCSFNLRLIQRGDHAALPFADYLTEYARCAQKRLFPFADRLQGLADREGLAVSETAFGDFDIKTPASVLIERAGLADGKDFHVRDSPGGGRERVFSAEAFKRCLLQAEGSDWVARYFICVEEAATAYSAYVIELARQRAAAGAGKAGLFGLGSLPARASTPPSARAPGPSCAPSVVLAPAPGANPPARHRRRRRQRPGSPPPT
jgi:hypothetical protein